MDPGPVGPVGSERQGGRLLPFYSFPFVSTGVDRCLHRTLLMHRFRPQQGHVGPGGCRLLEGSFKDMLRSGSLLVGAQTRISGLSLLEIVPTVRDSGILPREVSALLGGGL